MMEPASVGGDEPQCAAPLPSVLTVSMARSDSPLSALSLLEGVDMAWMVLAGAVLLSPVLGWTRRAGQYGKLRQGKQEEEDVKEEQKDGKQTQTAGDADAAAAPRPRLHVSTRTAFVSYYLFASVLNGLLLAEVMSVFFNFSYDNTPLLNLLRSAAAWFTPGATELASPRVHARSEAEGKRVLARLMMQQWLFQLHLMRRLYESVAITRFSQRSTQHGLVTILAFVYYFLAVVTPVIDSPVCATWDTGAFPLSNIALWVGVALFGLAWWGQHEAHVTLAQLREGGDKVAAAKKDDDADLKQEDKDSTGGAAPRYRIPYGGLFRFVSCPHYLCEMLAYTALWIVSGGKFSQFLICVWVYSNLCITAVRTHRWYHRQFPDYPRNRTAVIPMLL